MRDRHPPPFAAVAAAVVALLSACGTLDKPAGPNPGLIATRGAAFATTNLAPTAWINTPSNLATAGQGAPVWFAGGGSDPENGMLTGTSLVWKTSLNGQIGTGALITRSNLAVGKHTVTLTATDALGATSSQYRTLTITASANRAPVAAISSPLIGANFAQGAPVAFTGSGTDPEQGALTGAALVWKSSQNGQIGTGTSFSTSGLSAGTHTITLTAKDAGGLTATASRSVAIHANASPSVTISSPALYASFAQGASVQFSGSASDLQDGVLSGAALVWRSDRDGQIGTGTSFTRSNLNAGQHQISLTATDSRGAKTVTTRTITITSSPVATVSVTLSSTTAQVGAITTATAVLRNSSGALLAGRPIAWSTSNGALAKVSSTGLVTALGAGSVNVIAASEGKTGQASLTISAVSTQSSPTGANEPTGMTLITDRAFNCATTSCEGGWGGQSNNFTIVQDGTAPRSASSIGQMRYPAGMSGGVGPAQTWRSLGNRKTVYISTWLKFSSNFQNHSTGVNKVLHIWINGINRLVLIGRGQGLATVIGLQQLAAPYNDGRGQIATSVHLLPNVVSTAAMTRNQWHKIEIVLVANTPGLANGSVTMYQNGTKVLQYSGIMYAAAGGNGAWEQMNWNPTWGGMGGTVTSDMYMWMDHLYASGKN